VQRTGGAHKRTINVFTPNTEEGLQKFEEDIDEIHRSFAAHVAAHRPQLAPGAVAVAVAVAVEGAGAEAGAGGGAPGSVFTGETWLAQQAPPGLVDVLSTSDQYLRGRQLEAEVFLLEPAPAKKSPFDLGLLRLLTEAALEARTAAARLAGWGAALRGGGGGDAAGHAIDASAAAAAVSQLQGGAEAPWSHWPSKPLLRAPESGALGSDARFG
jgi:ClpP class serine protease